MTHVIPIDEWENINTIKVLQFNHPNHRVFEGYYIGEELGYIFLADEVNEDLARGVTALNKDMVIYMVEKDGNIED